MAQRSRGVHPDRIRVRMYQVGFGDCFLLSFEYGKALPDGRAERHVLIDFGSTHSAHGEGLKPVADLIRKHSGGQLDAVVVSHRHEDHLSAFGQPDIAELLTENGPPALVVRSWTEDPKVPRGAKSAKFLASLREARSFTGQVLRAIDNAPRSVVGDDLKQLAKDQLANAKAIKQLDSWSKGRNAAAYVHYGQNSGLEGVVPGVKVRVLGPPTVEQHPAVKSQRAKDPEEFWMLYKRLFSGANGAQLIDDAEPEASANGHHPRRLALGPLGPTRWLVDRMGRQQANSLLRIVRILDSALNNTSVILLFEVPSAHGTKRLLFGGDAQIENWEYALKVAPDAKANLRALREVDLYKVGHHGSRNATPRTLFNLWPEPNGDEPAMVSLMSTKHGVHGKHVETAVPRKTLVEALRRRTRLFSTDEFGRSQRFVELVSDLTKGGRFVEVNSPNR